MESGRWSRWLAIIGVALAAILLYLSFRGVAWSEMESTVRSGNAFEWGLAFPVLTASYFLRSLRWRALLRAVDDVGRVSAFRILCAGYLANMVLPARAGDVLRAALIARKSRVTPSYAFATTISERVVDSAALVIVGTAIVNAIPRGPAWLLTGSRVMMLVGVLGLAFVLVLPYMGNRIVDIIARLPISRTAGDKCEVALRQFLLGIKALHDPARAARFLVFTALIWPLDGLAALVVARSLKLGLGFDQALLLLAALGLASAAPSTPGYAGVYHFVAVTVLVPAGFTRASAIVYVLALQGATYALVLVWGPTGLWGGGTVRTQTVMQEPREIERGSSRAVVCVLAGDVGDLAPPPRTEGTRPL